MSIHQDAFDPILNPEQLFKVLVMSIRNNLPLLVKGAPGQGKTQITMQAAAHCDADFIPVFLSLKEPTSLEGFPSAQTDPDTGEKRAMFLPYGDMERILNATKTTVVVADDCGQAPKMMQATWMQVLHERQINGHIIPDCVRFVSCTNRKEDKAGVSHLIEPFKSKHAAIVELQNSAEYWTKWAAKSKRIQPEIIGFVHFVPDVIRAFTPTSDMVNTPTARGVEACNKIFASGINGEIRPKLFSGAIGKEYAIKLEGFIKFFQELPDPNKVIVDPENADIPSEPGHLYAMCASLAGRATPESIDNIIKYALRLPSEYSVALVTDAVRRNPELAGGKPFIEWSQKNADVLID